MKVKNVTVANTYKQQIPKEQAIHFGNTRLIKTIVNPFCRTKNNLYRKSITELFTNSFKKIETRFVKFVGQSVPFKTKTRSYANGKLTSKVETYLRKDKIGEYKAKVVTKYLPDGKTQSEVTQTKIYNFKREPGGITFESVPINITTKFSKGKRAEQFEWLGYPDRDHTCFNNWKRTQYDTESGEIISETESNLNRESFSDFMSRVHG